MSFFEPPPPPKQPEWPEPPKPQAWWHAPRNELGAPVPLRIVLARTDRVAIALIGTTAYTTGIELTVSVRLRRQDAEDLYDDPMEFPFGRPVMRRRQSGDLPPELLRFGIQFSDGRKATTVGSELPWRDSGDSEEEPIGPLLTPAGSGGGGGQWDSDFWLWPVPPPGPLTFAVEWPKENIELTKREVDASLVIEASKQSEILWPDSGGSGGSTSTFFALRRDPAEEEEP